MAHHVVRLERIGSVTKQDINRIVERLVKQMTRAVDWKKSGYFTTSIVNFASPRQLQDIKEESLSADTTKEDSLPPDRGP